ncbi:MAG: hypothetical protein HOW73_02710 [Polyangiaceae bacterium]|nr:hypothetical protein [Polyangiaceae bacterium]
MSIVARPLAVSFLFAAGVALFAGCGDKGSEGASASGSADAKGKGGKVASCNVIKSESLCREYGDKNVAAAGEEFLKKTCDGLKGEFKTEACPKEKRVGSCVTPEGTKVFYSDGGYPLEADKAEKNCKEGIPAGEWQAGK